MYLVPMLKVKLEISERTAILVVINMIGTSAPIQMSQRIIHQYLIR